MANSSPRLVDPGDLYDGPEPAPGAALEQRIAFIPPEKQDKRSRPDYVATITAALDMLNARLLGLIAVVAACLIWGWSVYQPEVLRTYAAGAFSLTVLLPVIVLYWRRG